MSGRGWIDLHSHLLPGIDDGCQSLGESIACVQRLIERGYAGSVCTPHVDREMCPDNTCRAIAQRVSELERELRAAGIEYRLWSGGELRIADDTIAWIEEIGVPTLGASKWVLVDYWGCAWPEYADELCHRLLANGYEVLLAHPERMNFEASHLETVLHSLQQRGVRLQGNFNSVSGGEGTRAAAVARRLLAENRYEVLALDMHRPDSLPSRFDGLARVEQELGSEELGRLIEQRPRAILSGS